MLALPSKSTFYVKISIWHGNSSHTEPYIEYINTHSRYITSALTTLIDNSTLNIHQPTFLDPVANEVRAQSLNSIFLFYFLALSLRSFTGSHGIVPIYIFTILLRNTISRSSWKWIARMISHWFQVWCKYFAEFAHNIILYSKCSKKITGLILYLNTFTYFEFPVCWGLALERWTNFCQNPICSPLNGNIQLEVSFHYWYQRRVEGLYCKFCLFSCPFGIDSSSNKIAG